MGPNHPANARSVFDFNGPKNQTAGNLLKTNTNKDVKNSLRSPKVRNWSHGKAAPKMTKKVELKIESTTGCNWDSLVWSVNQSSQAKRAPETNIASMSLQPIKFIAAMISNLNAIQLKGVRYKHSRSTDNAREKAMKDCLSMKSWYWEYLSILFAEIPKNTPKTTERRVFLSQIVRIHLVNRELGPDVIKIKGRWSNGIAAPSLAPLRQLRSEAVHICYLSADKRTLTCSGMCSSANRPLTIELARIGSVGVIQAASVIDSRRLKLLPTGMI